MKYKRLSRPSKGYYVDYETGDAYEVVPQHIQVEDSSSQFSGLFDAKGNPLYREKETIRFKFK